MRFLADESCDFAVVRALRKVGQDVLAVAESSPGVPDAAVIDRAVAEDRVLLTEDKDFGQLARARTQDGVGVVLIRFPMQARESLGGSVIALMDKFGPELPEHFTVLQPGRVRLTKFGR